MFTRVLKGGAAAALAGAAMLAISAGSASAFTLSSPSLQPPMASSNIDHVWCYHCGWGHPYWGPHRYWGPGWGWRHRHCGWNRWGHWVCW
jgi:hypothetical protein